MAPLIVKHTGSCKSVSNQLHAPAALLLEKEASIFIKQEVVWAPEPVWALWRREKSLSGNRTIILLSSSPYPITAHASILHNKKIGENNAVRKEFINLNTEKVSYRVTVYCRAERHRLSPY
jgi:hypothetical protein